LPLQRSAIQRNGTEPPAAAGGSGEGGAPAVDPSTLPLETGRLDETTETITFSEIQVPGFKLRDHRGALYGARRLKQKKGYSRGEPDQRGAWRTALADAVPSTTEVLRQKLRTARGGQDPPASEPTVFKARTAQGAQRYFLGPLETVAAELALPSWDQAGRGHSYDVDHIVELQLANWDVEGWANTLENMELLDSSMNRSSGSTIKGAIDAKVQSFIEATDRAYGGSVATVKGKYHLEFQQAAAGGGDNPQPKTHFWTAAHLRAGDHLGPVEVGSIGELGGEGTVVVFPSAAGGQPKQFSTGTGIGGGERDWLKPYNITAKSFTTEAGQETSPELGSLTFVMPEGHDKYEPSGAGPTTLQVARVPGARFAGSIDKAAVRRALLGLRVKRLSPIQLADVDVAPGGIQATGKILPDVPLLQGTGIDFELLGDALTFSKAFAGPEIQAPRPFEVRESTLVVSAGTRGLAIDGRVDFAIERVGEGHLGARAGTSEGFALEGGFSFDSALFDPAEIEATYENGNLTATGRLGVPAGKVKGLESASVEVTYNQEEGRLAASGNAELDLPGVSRGEMTVTYAEGEGLTIGGAFDLSGDVPGINGGRVEARLERPEGGEWKLAVSGTARPAIPGVDSQLAISYDDGVFDMSVRAGYQRGMAAGTVEVGVTNRAIDEEGRPGGDAGDTLTPYGGGSVTLTLAPWLQATAGLRLLPDGSMEVQGEIGLPSALEIFPEKSYERNLFRVGLDIPIVGVAVAGQRIGIFATISGGLDLSAGVGPGTLSQLAVGITYNPEHEEDTRITGDAELQVPAHAGLRLSVRGGLGAGIPIVSATAALEIGGALGLEGMARAGVHLDWSPGQGLVIDAEGEIYVEPALVFDVTGMVLVEADLLVSTIELYSQRWQLAGFSLGSGLRFGLRFPVHYEEGQPFDLDWNQVEFEVPEIDTDQVLAGLMAQIV
ncbi:MAG TPA: hypothetical protein VHQ65_02550, partial [Thermoanaerobaculia bacterium]|nr:hypothetical protein [Thermoanaerobaculia bacterium]